MPNNTNKAINKVPLAYIRPSNSLNLLSHREIEGVMNTDDKIFDLFVQCALAVLNTGSEEDDVHLLNQQFNDFKIRIISESRGIKLAINNAPISAFVDGKMIKGIQEHLFSVLRDIIYTHHKISVGGRFDLTTSSGITDAVFRILRNASIVKPNTIPAIVVCWGGHSIKRHEYDYSKQVGYALGLRGLNIATGCGTGAMKGPMKGAVIGHGKQQILNGRYIGITEPGIIASESPNPTVNELVILPDIEKRLEAFVRLAHGIVVFPGGAGTAEEILYLLGILMHPNNQTLSLPLVFAAPEENSAYFKTLDQFIQQTLGADASHYYQIIVGNPDLVAQTLHKGVETVKRHRRHKNESYAYNWQLFTPQEFQHPFEPSHRNMNELQLHTNQPAYLLAAELRKAFSGIVAGNVKTNDIARIKQHGPYIIRGEAHLINALEQLLNDFITQGRMKLKGNYTPCYTIASDS